MNRPNKITVPNYVDTGQAIYIKWDAVDGATEYKLERAVDRDFFSAVYTGQNTDYIDIALDGWNEVKYRVCALDDTETSEYISSTKVMCAYFKIDANGKLQPFNLIVNFKESSIDVLPNIRESSETISGEDGEISLDIKYEPRTFDLDCFSANGRNYETWQRDNAITSIARAIHKAKNSERYLMYNGKFYKVRIAKKPEYKINPDWFEAQIAFKAYDPYGYSFENSACGECTIKNSGEEKAYPVIYIEGITSQPKFIINGTTYQLKTDMVKGDYVEINSKIGAVYKNGVNITEYWESDFPLLDVGENTIKLPENCKIVWQDKFIAI